MKAIMSVGLLFVSLFVQAEVKLHWEFSETVLESYDQTQSSMSIMHSKISGTDFVTTTSTFVQLKNPQGKTDLNQLVNNWKNTYPNIRWKISLNQTSRNLEGHWKEMNRYVYVKLIKLSEAHFAMASTITRPVFKSELDKTIKTIHSYFERLNEFEQTDGDHKQLETSWTSWFVSDAYAQGMPFPMPPGGLPPGLAGLLGPLVGPLNAINTGLTTLNATLASGVQEWSRTNDIAEQLLDTKKMAKHGLLVGAATAAGAALGGWVANLAIDGITEGIKYLAKQIFGFERRRLLWEDFKKARDNWPALDAHGIELQKKMDHLLAILAMVKTLRPTDILKNAIEQKAKFQAAKDTVAHQYSELIANNTGPDECKVHLNKWTDYLDQNIKNLDHFITDFHQSGPSSADGMKSYFCGKIDQVLRQIYAVNDLRNANRIDLLAGGKEFYRVYRKQQRIRRRKLRRINSLWYQQRLQTLGNRVIGIIEGQAMKRQRQSRRQFLDRCYTRQNSIGEQLWLNLAGKRFRGLKHRKACRTSYAYYIAHHRDNELNDVFVRSTDAKSNMKMLDIALKHEPVHPNSAGSADHIGSITKWFEQLQYEAKCVNQITNDRVAEACLRAFPGAMKPLLAGRRGGQAARALGCQNDYYRMTQLIDGTTQDHEIAEGLAEFEQL